MESPKPKLFQDLYAKEIVTTRPVEVETTPTLIESIYNTAKLLFNKTVKEFLSADDAEQWAELNCIKIKIRHKAGSFVGDNMIERNGYRDDTQKMKGDLR